MPVDAPSSGVPISRLWLLASLLVTLSLLHLLHSLLHLTGCGLKIGSFCQLSFKRFRHYAAMSLLWMQLHMTMVTMLYAPISAAQQTLSCRRSTLVTSGSMRLSHSSLLLCSITCIAGNCHLTALLHAFLCLAILCQC